PLRILKIAKTKSSSAGIAEVAAALPKCTIFADGGVVMPRFEWSLASASAGRPDSRPVQPHVWPSDTPPPAIAPFDDSRAKAYQEAWARHLEVPAHWEGPCGIRFQLIPPGEFVMGSSGAEV